MASTTDCSVHSPGVAYGMLVAEVIESFSIGGSSLSGGPLRCIGRLSVDTAEPVGILRFQLA